MGIFDRGGFFDNLGHDIDHFFKADIPAAARDVGHFVENVVTGGTKLIGTGIHNITQPIIGIPKEVITGVLPPLTQSASKLIPLAAQGGKTLLEGTAGVTGSLSMPLTVGIGVAGVLLIIMMMNK